MPLAGSVNMLATLKQLAKKFPFVAATHRAILNSTRSTENVFTEIYRSNAWNGKESVSGYGSDTDQVKIVSAELPRIFQEFGIKSILDIPCGDFFWMKDVDRSGVDYLGADIVEDLILENTKRYGGDGVRFEKLNLIDDALPQVDLVFCRDCLVHLPNSAVMSALVNICKSNSTYLLATTFPRGVTNADIAIGKWRPLDLEASPFELPTPVELINEGCTVRDGAYSDKSLGLWRLADLRQDPRFRT